MIGPITLAQFIIYIERGNKGRDELGMRLVGNKTLLGWVVVGCCMEFGELKSVIREMM